MLIAISHPSRVLNKVAKLDDFLSKYSFVTNTNKGCDKLSYGELSFKHGPEGKVDLLISIWNEQSEMVTSSMRSFPGCPLLILSPVTPRIISHYVTFSFSVTVDIGFQIHEIHEST